MGIRLALCGLLAALGCGEHASYKCVADRQCTLAGASGVCQPQGYCSFADSECPSGQRFEADAAEGFGGTCVPEGNGMPDSGMPSCGTLDGACCATGDACGNNLFCDNGSCKQCIVDITSGTQYGCFVKYDGTVWCSGRNDQGNLGNGGTSTLPNPTPTQVKDSNLAPVTDATAVVAAQNYTCAIRAGGTVWCWGTNGNCNNGGQLGNGDYGGYETLPEQVEKAGGGVLTDIVEVASDYCRACARDSAGGVWCWGSENDGGLGDGTGVPHAQAAPVLAAAGGAPFTNVAQLSANGGHACLRTTTNEIYCWGDNDTGAIGNDSRTSVDIPVKVFDGTSVAAGRRHTCATKADGSVYCWGLGRQGRLGNGTGDPDSGDSIDMLLPSPALTSVGGNPFTGAASVSAGASSCALMQNKDLYCWGIDYYGQVGTGGGTYVPRPVLRTDGTPLKNVERVIARYTRTCAFTSDGALYCWGRNSEGTFGDGTLFNHGLATPIKQACP